MCITLVLSMYARSTNSTSASIEESCHSQLKVTSAPGLRTAYYKTIMHVLPSSTILIINSFVKHKLPLLFYSRSWTCRQSIRCVWTYFRCCTLPHGGVRWPWDELISPVICDTMFTKLTGRKERNVWTQKLSVADIRILKAPSEIKVKESTRYYGYLIAFPPISYANLSDYARERPHTHTHTPSPPCSKLFNLPLRYYITSVHSVQSFAKRTVVHFSI